MPRFSEDDYVDFCVIEALAVRSKRDEQQAQRQQDIAQWKKGAKSLAPGGSGGSRFG